MPPPSPPAQSKALARLRGAVRDASILLAAPLPHETPGVGVDLMLALREAVRERLLLDKHLLSLAGSVRRAISLLARGRRDDALYLLSGTVGALEAACAPEPPGPEPEPEPPDDFPAFRQAAEASCDFPAVIDAEVA